MRATTAERLFLALGAPAALVNDLLGDIEELRAQRLDGGEPAGRTWYIMECLRALPYLLRAGLQGAGAGDVVDWLQKALSAWLLIFVGQLYLGGLSYGSWLVIGPHLTPHVSRAVGLGAMLFGLPLLWVTNALLIGYLASWMERKRPLIVVTVAALLVGASTYVLLGASPDAAMLALPGAIINTTLVLLGGVWRSLRRPTSVVLT